MSVDSYVGREADMVMDCSRVEGCHEDIQPEYGRRSYHICFRSHIKTCTRSRHHPAHHSFDYSCTDPRRGKTSSRHSSIPRNLLPRSASAG